MYTARHQGMGGTAIGYVHDPSAAFHNPAGLQHTRGLEVLGNFSLILAEIQSSPDAVARNEESKTIVAPFPMLAASYRFGEWFTGGVAVFPSGSGAADYEYDFLGAGEIEDNLQVVFVEATVLGSLNVPEDLLLPGKLAFGAGWRATYVSFDRKRGDPDDPRLLNLELTGLRFVGYRLGLQWEYAPEFSFGAVYRSRVDVTASADDAVVFNQTARDVELDFIFPSRLGLGVRSNLGRFGIAFDWEHTWQSQNDDVELTGELGGNDAAVPNIFDWQNNNTARAGLEYRAPVGQAHVPVRVGYVFDGKATNEAFPTAFGTPPTPTNSFTAGSGYVTPDWQINGAIAYRFGSTTIEPSDLGTGCAFCSLDGDYELDAMGFYLDASGRFDL